MMSQLIYDSFQYKLTWIWKKDPWCLFDTSFSPMIIGSGSIIFGKGICYGENETDKNSNNSSNKNWKQSKAIERTRPEIHESWTLTPIN